MKNNSKNPNSNTEIIQLTKSDKYIQFYLEMTLLIEDFCYIKGNDLLVLSMSDKKETMTEEEYLKTFNLIDFGLWNDFKAEIKILYSKYSSMGLFDDLKMLELRSSSYTKHIIFFNEGEVIYTTNIEMNGLSFKYRCFYDFGESIQGNSTEQLISLKLQRLFDDYRNLELKAFYDLSKILSTTIRINEPKILKLLNQSLTTKESYKQLVNFSYHMQIRDYQEDLVLTWYRIMIKSYVSKKRVKKESIEDTTNKVVKLVDTLRKLATKPL